MFPRAYAALLTVAIASQLAAQQYDLLLKGGHLIDARNNIDAVRDVAIKNGRVASVAENIRASAAVKTIDISGLYVSPEFVDMHAHFWGTPATWLHPDSHTLRAGVTTVVDAGGSGWRSFGDFQRTVMQNSSVRVLAWLKIVGRGMAGRAAEQDKADMDVQARRVN